MKAFQMVQVYGSRCSSRDANTTAPGCHNPQTWSFQGGNEYSVDELINQLPDNSLIKGVTLSGGDPFYQPLAAAEIAKDFHRRGKDVWAYTGFLWEEILNNRDLNKVAFLNQCDVLIDGPYVQPQRDPSLPFRGSSNQRLILVKESLLAGNVLEWKSAYP